MTDLEFCIARRQAERPVFIRVPEAIPADGSDYVQATTQPITT